MSWGAFDVTPSRRILSVYDTQGKLTATKDTFPPAPWAVVESMSQPGRWYFYRHLQSVHSHCTVCQSQAQQGFACE